MLSPAEDVELRDCYFHGGPAAHPNAFLGQGGLPSAAVVPTLLGQLSFAQLGGHIDGQINGQINGQLDGRPLNGHLNGQLSARIAGQLTGQLTGSLPLQSLPITIAGSESQPEVPVTALYPSHLPSHTLRQSQILLPDMADPQPMRADSISQMQLLLDRSRSALDRIDLHLPGSPDCESQLNEEFAFRSPRGHKDGKRFSQLTMLMGSSLISFTVSDQFGVPGARPRAVADEAAVTTTVRRHCKWTRSPLKLLRPPFIRSAASVWKS
jgi:hypothetical protein